MTFAESLRLKPPLGVDFGAIHARIDVLDAEGGTALMDGTFAALTLGDALVGRALPIVFTDGLENVSWLREGDVIEAARRSDVVVYAVRAGGACLGEGAGAVSELEAAIEDREPVRPDPFRSYHFGDRGEQKRRLEAVKAMARGGGTMP